MRHTITGLVHENGCWWSKRRAITDNPNISDFDAAKLLLLQKPDYRMAISTPFPQVHLGDGRIVAQIDILHQETEYIATASLTSRVPER